MKEEDGETRKWRCAAIYVFSEEHVIDGALRMTVRELIDELRKLPLDVEVKVDPANNFKFFL